MASLVNRRFTRDVAIDLQTEESKQHGDENEPDVLHMGLFVVTPKKEEKNFQTKLEVFDKDLKIVLFLCRKERDRQHLHNSGFAIVGNFLCWSYPEERLVHVLDMHELNEVQATKRKIENSAISAVLDVQDMAKQVGAMFLGGQTAATARKSIATDISLAKSMADDEFSRAEELDKPALGHASTSVDPEAQFLNQSDSNYKPPRALNVSDSDSESDDAPIIRPSSSR